MGIKSPRNHQNKTQCIIFSNSYNQISSYYSKAKYLFERRHSRAQFAQLSCAASRSFLIAVVENLCILPSTFLASMAGLQFWKRILSQESKATFMRDFLLVMTMTMITFFLSLK